LVVGLQRLSTRAAAFRNRKAGLLPALYGRTTGFQKEFTLEAFFPGILELLAVFYRFRAFRTIVGSELARALNPEFSPDFADSR
jgi:hypothetical protein